MDRRTFIKTAGVGGVSLAAGADKRSPSPAQSRGTGPKNVIWMMGDQHRAQAVGYMGDANARTPFLNDLSIGGVTFSNAVSGCPWCTPFRGSLFTSRYIHRCVDRTPQRIDPGLPTVTDVFRANGYVTAFFGKWHLSGGRDFVPREERGRFDMWIGYENTGGPDRYFEARLHGHDLWGRDDKVPDAEPIGKYETDYLTDKLLDFLKRRPRNKPFFAVLSVQPPHNPYVAPPEYMNHFKANGIELRPNVPESADREKHKNNLAGYYAQIENLDYNIGRVAQALEDLGIDKDTHFAYFSDHGDCHGAHGYVRKSSPWEESVRIPCLFKPAGEAPKQRFSDAPFNHVDFAPTTLGMCGIDVPEWMAGTDFSHHILPSRVEPEEEPDSAFLQHSYRKRFDCLNRPWRGIRTKDGWKYVILEGQPIMLFNLNEDPFELTNLVYLDTYNEKREDMHHRLAEWLRKTGDRFRMPEL